MDKLRKTVKESISNFEKSFPIDSIREDLRIAGVNLDDRKTRQDKFIKQLKFKLSVKSNREKQQELLLTASQKFLEALDNGLDKPVAYLNNLIQNNKIQFQYSNLKKISEEEIKEIIKDQNLIEIIEMIENESKGE
ncbi:hypothetical protein ACJRPK_06245 [Aquimarina sp. 2-A2]|uniref:hypothetical protein n=1 Tax=Aquimarina sp. 2-A2 TaxID=3382644 RepID=UPI00387F0F6E